MSIIENWIQSEDENDLISSEKILQMEARMNRSMNKNGVLRKNNNNCSNVTTNSLQISESESNIKKKALLDPIDMDHESNDSTETVEVQEKESGAIQEPNESNTFPTAKLHNKVLDYQAESLPEIDNNDEPFKTPQMDTCNNCTPILNGAASKSLESKTASEVDHLLEDDEAAANLYLEILKILQPNLSKPSTNTSSTKCLIEEEVILLKEQDQQLHHIGDEIVNEHSLDSTVAHHDIANDNYFDNAKSKQIDLRNRPDPVSGSYPQDQTPLVFNCIEQPRRNYQSLTTGFSQVQSHNQYSNYHVDGDGGDHITFDNEIPFVPHRIGLDSAVAHYDPANNDLYYSKSKEIDLQNSPASVNYIYPKNQTPLVFNCIEQPHRNYQSETTGFCQVQSRNQYSNVQVDGDCEDHIAVDTEIPLVAHRTGMTPLNDNGKEIRASHESVGNQRNVAAPEQVNTSGTASIPSNTHPAAEPQAQATTTLNNESRLAIENMNLYKYSQDLYMYVVFSEVFKSQITSFISQTIIGVNNLNQLMLLAREISSNQQSVIQNSTPQTEENTSKSQISNNEKEDRTRQNDRTYSRKDQIERGNGNVTKKVVRNIGRKKFHVGALKPGLQNTSKFRKRPQAATAIGNTMRIKRFKNKENRNEDEYEIENLDNSSPERWLDAVPRKIDFGASKSESCRTPKRPSKYIRNKKK